VPGGAGARDASDAGHMTAVRRIGTLMCRCSEAVQMVDGRLETEVSALDAGIQPLHRGPPQCRRFILCPDLGLKTREVQ